MKEGRRKQVPWPLAASWDTRVPREKDTPRGANLQGTILQVHPVI